MSEPRTDPNAPPKPYAGISPDQARSLLRAHGANMPYDRKEALQAIAASGERVGRTDPVTGEPARRALSPFGNETPKERTCDEAGFPGEPMALCDIPRAFKLVDVSGHDERIHFPAGTRRVPLRFLRQQPPANLPGDFTAYPHLGMHEALEINKVKIVEWPREVEDADTKRREALDQISADGLKSPDHIVAAAHETAAQIINDARDAAQKMIDEMIAKAKAELVKPIVADAQATAAKIIKEAEVGEKSRDAVVAEAQEKAEQIIADTKDPSRSGPPTKRS